MSSVPESRMTETITSDVYLANMMSDPERGMHNQTNASFLATFRRQEHKVQEQIGTLHNALRSENEDPSSLPEHGVTPAPETLSKF